MDEIIMEDVMSLIPVKFKKAISHSGEALIECPLAAGQEICLNVRKGQFKCFHDCAGCPVNGRGRAVNLYRLYNPDMSFKDAVKAINEHTSSVSSAGHRQVQPKVLTPIEQVPQASPKEKNNTFRCLLNMLELDEIHRQDLLRRGLTDSQISEFGIKSLPTVGQKSIPKQLAAFGCRLEGVPLFAKQNGEWVMCLPRQKSGYFIPYFDIHGRIEQLQIRFDVDLQSGLSKDEIEKLKGARYRWASSSSYEQGTSAHNIPFWGRIGTFYKEADAVCVTEGGLKATVASYLSDSWFVAIPGVSCTDAFRQICQFCKRTSKTMIDGFDMDGKVNEAVEHIVYRGKGEKIPRALYTEEIKTELERTNRLLVMANDRSYLRVVNGSVMNALQKMHEIAEAEGVTFLPYYWDARYKGVDDWLQSRHLSGKSTALQEEAPAPVEEAVEESSETTLTEDMAAKEQPEVESNIPDDAWYQESILGPVVMDDGVWGTYIPQ